MADDQEAQQLVATSNDFRILAGTVGVELNKALQGLVESADKSQGFILAHIQDKNYLKIIRKAVMDFELKEFPKLHPNRQIDWHRWIHIFTESIGPGAFKKDDRDLLLLPMFVGKAETQTKIVGQPQSLKTEFQLIAGDILLFYKSVAVSEKP